MSRVDEPKNVLGEPLELCSRRPLTGFTRSGSCDTGSQDVGVHTVCVRVTQAFLDFSRARQGPGHAGAGIRFSRPRAGRPVVRLRGPLARSPGGRLRPACPAADHPHARTPEIVELAHVRARAIDLS